MQLGIIHSIFLGAWGMARDSVSVDDFNQRVLTTPWTRLNKTNHIEKRESLASQVVGGSST